MTEGPWKPTRAQLSAAYDKRIPDVTAPDLDVLFCGINPGLYSGAVGHHFARPGNRFWPALHLSGFTPRQLSPFEDRALLDYSMGVVNLVNRTTARADELSRDEIEAGAVALERKVQRLRPRVVALLGIGIYRLGWKKKAEVGPQDQMIGETKVWLLPNPSGLNAHYQLDALVVEFKGLRTSARR